MRRKARVDTNQREIVNFARHHGCTVAHLHAVGKGIPDLLIGYRGRNYLVEVKSSENGALTKETFFNNWRGDAAVVATKKDLIRLLDLPMGSLPMGSLDLIE